MPGHDVNMSLYDGHELKYIKLERTKQEKRFHFRALPDWKQEAETIWHIDVAEIDDVVFSFDPAALPPELRSELGAAVLQRLGRDASKAERLSSALCAYLGVRRGWFASHHYSHALSTWMLEPRPPEVCIVIDGLGDGRPWSVYKNGSLVAAGDIRNGSIGWGIREAGKLLGVSYGHYNDIAGKVMGLQSYGILDQGYYDYLDRFDFGQLKAIWSVEHWYAYKHDALLGKLSHLDWIATVHAKMGAMLLAFFQKFASAGDCISYSGGVAQNVVWNSLLRQVFPNLVIAPHASDEGLSLGAIEWLRRQHAMAPLTLPAFPWAQSDAGVAPPSQATIERAAHMLAEGKIVGWYQGFGEIGPRALGNRSILMDPRLVDGKARINSVKNREQYRPFGASVLAEHFDDYFDGPADGFMLYACQLRSGSFPAITHVDRSCRVQLVSGDNQVFRQLVAAFFALTGCPLLLNTSLNLAGKPIAALPQHAVDLFEASSLDAMVIGDQFHYR